MNSKQIACGLVVLFVLMFIQATRWVEGLRTKMQREAEAALQAENQAAMTLSREQSQLLDLRRQSAGLMDFLKTWQPYFETIDTPQSAEVNFTMRVKESNLINLSQRFELAGVKGNASVPSMLRAYLTFEDEYARLLNWLGRTEADLPTVRVSSIHLSKGSRSSDLRMEVVLEQPLLRK